jgi:hypothetical protein
VAQWIGMPERVVNQISGHSTRVGATQDLAAQDIDLAAITQAGGWKSTRMLLQYAEKINASARINLGWEEVRCNGRKLVDGVQWVRLPSGKG